jgi:DNA-binding NtrC family response regulator
MSSEGLAASNPLVLIVDDEIELCEAVALDLVLAGFSIANAFSCEAAHRIIQQDNVAVVISDVRIAESSGLQLLSEIKATHQDMPVFLMTGYTDLSEEAARQKGAEGIIHKPMDPNDLLGRIKQALERRGLAAPIA